MKKHNVVSSFWSGVSYIQSIGKVEEYLEYAQTYVGALDSIDGEPVDDETKKDTFDYIKMCATSRTIEQYLEDKGETELLEHLNKSDEEDEEYITEVAVEFLEDYKSWFISLYCNGENSTGTPQHLINFARFAYRDDAIEYAVKIHVSDDVKLALIENDKVNYYEREQAYKLLEEIKG